jgi:uncharacterized protein YcnI
MKVLSAAFAFAIALITFSANAQTTQVSTDYLMTMHIPTECTAIDGKLVVVNILARRLGIAKMAKYKRTKAEAYVEYEVIAAR